MGNNNGMGINNNGIGININGIGINNNGIGINNSSSSGNKNQNDNNVKENDNNNHGGIDKIKDDSKIENSSNRLPTRESVFQIVTLSEIQKLANKIIRRRKRSRSKTMNISTSSRLCSYCTEKKNVNNGAVGGMCECPNQSMHKDGNGDGNSSSEHSDDENVSEGHSLECSAGVHCLVTSMVNCYGLKNLHEYLQIPFLRVKKSFFTNQLLQTERALDRLDSSLRTQLLPSDKHSYSNFVAAYETRVR